ncbi:MAG: amidohydrolase [Clostridia bacterium]|nr:amidohydrolase [Clostridia bacterium]
MLFSNITILDENFEVKENMYVAVKADRIEYIGKEKPLEDYGRVYDGKGKLLMPGFVNSHAHGAMTLMRGYGENLKLNDWLETKVYPFEDQFDHDAVYWSTMLSMAESLKYGIVSSSDMYFWIDDMVKAISDSKTKINLSRSIVCFDDSDIWDLPSVKEMERCVKAYHGGAGGRILMDASVHAEYTNTLKSTRQLAQYTKDLGINMHVHASETKFEHEECKKRHGVTPTRFFYDNGVFDTRATAAHLVWAEDEDLDLLKEKDVTVCVNPLSNMKLASGIANVPKFLDKGIRVAIGTDSVASNNSLNFFEEMKTFAMASKVMLGDPTVITPKETLMAATVNGMVGQGRLDSGLVKEGFKADLIVVDLDQPNMHPIHNLLNNLVYSGDGPVTMTMVDGEVLYEEGNYYSIDIERTIFEADKATERILKKI